MEGELIKRSKPIEDISDECIKYNVRYTQLVSVEKMLTKKQIKELIDDPSIQLITIEKL